MLIDGFLNDESDYIDLLGLTAFHCIRKTKGDDVSTLIDSRFNCVKNQNFSINKDVSKFVSVNVSIGSNLFTIYVVYYSLCYLYKILMLSFSNIRLGKIHLCYTRRL